MQVFNRGNFSDGHLNSHPNTDFIFKEKPNNMGLFLGHIAKYTPQKGLIKIAINEPLEIGDTIAIENENGTYTISELMKDHVNIKTATCGDFVTIGRMKGKIKVGDKVYKMSSKSLSKKALSSFENDKQTKQIPLDCTINIQKNKPISIDIKCNSNFELYNKLNIHYEINSIPIEAIKRPLEKEKVISQLSKTTNTPYFFKNINVNLEPNIFLPNIKSLNCVPENLTSMGIF